MEAQINAPSLKPTGTPMPLLQRLVMRYYVKPFVAGKSEWSASAAMFERLSDRILKQVGGLSDADLSTRVLVPPQIGLEDSSRYWSIAMTLEHMVVAGTAISQLIIQLSQGYRPDLQVDLGRVKPQGDLTPAQSLERFRRFAESTPAELERAVGNRHSTTTLPHPWFGEMTAKEWYWLLANHMAIHLKQIKNIKQGLHWI